MDGPKGPNKSLHVYTMYIVTMNIIIRLKLTLTLIIIKWRLTKVVHYRVYCKGIHVWDRR